MKISDAMSKPVESLHYTTDYEWPLPRCLIGLEFEAENPRSWVMSPAEKKSIPWYSVKGDGSLRDNGLEFVLTRPLFGDDLRDAIEGMCTLGNKVALVSNYRTGLHVHMDVRDMEQDQLRILLMLYALYEKSVFSLVSSDRWNNNFSVPWGRHCSQLYEASRICDPSISPADAMSIARGLERYSALNLNSLHLFGSLEWRHAQTTFDSAWIVTWVSLIQQFKKAATTLEWTEQDLLVKFSTLGSRRFTEICGFSDYFEVNERDMWEALTLAQELVRVNTALKWEDPLLSKYRITKKNGPEPINE